MWRCLTLVVVAIVALCPVRAWAEGGDWRKERMSLGHRAEVRPAPGRGDELTPERTEVKRQCKRWKALAIQLGETYAGYRLRETVLQRVCGMSGEEIAGEIWDWPWASLDGEDILPPRLHRTMGPWEIRCDTAGERRRCALLHRLPLPEVQGQQGETPELIIHFVIDMVAGRESVLWRMFVPGMAARPARAELAAVGMTAGEARQARGQVRYRIGAHEFAEGFPACGMAGCLMESHVQRGGVVVSRLWDGKAIELGLVVAQEKDVVITIPARGFRAAFGELTRLRREELRGARRR